MTTHMLRHASTNCKACGVPASDLKLVFVGWCRGMLAGPTHGATGLGHGSGEAARGGDRTPSRGQGGGRANAGVEEDVGTSRRRGFGAGREVDGGSSSEGA